jgi:phosphatidylglycerophosphate synthase
MKLIHWNTYHGFVLLAASVAFIFEHYLLFFIVPAIISFFFLFYFSHKELKNLKPYAGWANRITLIRYLATVALALGYTNLSNLQIAILLGFIIPLDGIDGYLARKRQEQTTMGAYFDMEVDVFFVCIASCILFVRGLSGYEILIIGFFRYFYVPMTYLLGLRYIKEQRTKIGPVIAVFVFAVITISFVVPDVYRKVLVYSALILLIISFSYSFKLLLADKYNNRICKENNK